MIKIVFIFLLSAHTLIHLIGVSRSFHTFGKSAAFFKSDAMLWLMSFVLFLMSLILFLLENNTWKLFIIIAIILSQLLIFINWKEAKYGTIINFLFCAGLVLGIIHC